MKVEKDLIKREIQKINLFLTTLIEKVSGLNLNTVKNGMEEINEDFNKFFKLTLKDFSEIENVELLKKLKTLDESHIEKLIHILYEVVIKAEIIDFKNYNKVKIAKKGVFLIDFLNEKSTTFSIDRMNKKNKLQKHANT